MSRYWYTADGRTKLTTSATPVVKRGLLQNVSSSNVTINVTYDDPSMAPETAAIIPPGILPVWVKSVNTASANDVLYLLTNSKIDGKQ